ncbi:MAG: hypothetical protein MI975_19975 [Cytophagales bacterium]|nr:hypothetical protein [Cytophagales bacterium]
MIDFSFILYDYSSVQAYTTELPYYLNHSGKALDKLYLESSYYREHITIGGKRAGSTVIDSVTATCPDSFSKALAVCYRYGKEVMW